MHKAGLEWLFRIDAAKSGGESPISLAAIYSAPEVCFGILEGASLGGQDVDSKVMHLLKAEYLRRLSQYRRVDLLLTQKYGMSFDGGNISVKS